MTARKIECGSLDTHGGRFDGILVWNRHIEYMLIEGAKTQRMSGTGTKSESHLHRLARGLNDALYAIYRKIGTSMSDKLQPQVIGALEQGSEWIVYGLQRHGNISCMRRHFRLGMPTSIDTIQDLSNILKFSVRIYYHVKWTHDQIREMDTGEERRDYSVSIEPKQLTLKKRNTSVKNPRSKKQKKMSSS